MIRTNLITARTVNLSLVLITILIGLSLLMGRVDMTLKARGVDSCMKMSRFEKVDELEKTKVAYPVLDVYKTCLKNKGY